MFAFSLTEFDPLFNIIQRIATRVTANYFHLPFLRLAAVLDGVIIAVYLCRDWRLMRWTREFLRRFVKVEIIAPLPVPHRFLTALFIAVFVFSAAYFFHQNFDIQFVQIIAHRQFFTDGGLNAIIGDFVSAPLGLAVVAVGLLLIIERLRVRFERKFFFALIPVIGLIAVGAVGFYTGAIDYFRQQSQPPSTFYEEHYLDPKEIKISFSDKKRNLLVIFVESLETGFLPTTDGGAWREDCLPNVKEIAATDLNFSQNDYLGGAAQLAGTGWTLAAIVSYFTGVPEIIPFIGGNDLDKLGEKFMPGTVALGDILTANGYRNYFLCGSEAAFAGRDKFFKTHGDATIYDYNYFRDHRYFPADYRVWWGFEDRKLYAYAQEKLTAAAQADAPFCFTMLTVDTHPVGGYLDPQADKKLSSPFRNVVADADKLLGEFIAWLKQQEFYENTTVVILGDHLYMDNTVFPTAVVGAGEKSDDDRFGNGARRPLNIFINSPLSPKFAKNRQFSHFDIFPTLVEAVGGKIAAPGLGLGRSMSSGEKTLLEELGYDAVNDQLKRPSRRYDELWINNSGGGDAARRID
ncbi:hypothetical protein FACS1894139_19150 [Planctomycetales bacterium]|nr:hypothetical protein FACS1894139_19150 [Planctomycetales bacterium]